MSHNPVQATQLFESLGESRLALWHAQSRLLTRVDETAHIPHMSGTRPGDDWFCEAFDSAAVGMALVDLRGHWLRINPALSAIVGYCPEELSQRTFTDITHPDDLDTNLVLSRQLLAGETPSFSLEKRYLHRAGHYIWVLVTVALLRTEQGEPRYFIAQVQDISERKAAEELLRRQATLLDLAHDAVIVLDINHCITYWNPGAEEIYGWAAHDVLGRNIHNLLKTEFPVSAEVTYTQLQESGRWEGELCQTTRSGWQIITLSWHALVRDEHGDPVAILEINCDITGRKAVEQQLAWLAMHDEITNLPNRSLLLDRIDTALASARRYQGMIAVLFIDVDNFKTVNDSHGHAVGDTLLSVVAQRIRGCLREEDTASRIGGDEFAVLLREVRDCEDAHLVANRIRLAITNPFIVHGGLAIEISCSIGIAVNTDRDITSDVLLNRADYAMYHAKRAGKNRVICADAIPVEAETTA